LEIFFLFKINILYLILYFFRKNFEHEFHYKKMHGTNEYRFSIDEIFTACTFERAEQFLLVSKMLFTLDKILKLRFEV
jgi:hypothetical protein